MTHTTHEEHTHQHEEGCGHTAVEHEGHIDYLHDGHLHHQHGDHYDEHVIAVSSANPEACAVVNCNCGHADGCAHEAVPHGDHIDFIVAGQLHHPHNGHCDNHGAIATI